jgi:hypothetical protein
MAEELAGRLKEMEKSLEALESQVREQTLRTQSGTRTVLVVGIIVIAVLFVWLAFVAVWIKDEMKPEKAAETVAAMVSNNIPALKAALVEHAPDVVANARQMVVSDIPRAREWAEEKSLALVDVFGDRLEDKMNGMVGKIIETHRAELQPLIEAAATPGNAAKLQEIFRTSMEDMFGQQLDEVLQDFNASMTGVEHRLDRYKLPDAQLSPDEQLEKAILSGMMSVLNQAVQEPGAATGNFELVPKPAPTTKSAGAKTL